MAENKNCKGCEKKELVVLSAARTATVLAGNAAVGLGIGVTVGLGALVVAAVAEAAIPAILTFQALGLAGGALGFLKGARELKVKK